MLMAEVVVKYKNGKEVVYRNRGIEKLRKQFSSCVSIIDKSLEFVDSSGDEDDLPHIKGNRDKQQNRPRETKKVGDDPIVKDGTYCGLGLNYSIPKGKTVEDVARIMKQQVQFQT